MTKSLLLSRSLAACAVVCLFGRIAQGGVIYNAQNQPVAITNLAIAGIDYELSIDYGDSFESRYGDFMSPSPVPTFWGNSTDALAAVEAIADALNAESARPTVRTVLFVPTDAGTWQLGDYVSGVISEFSVGEADYIHSGRFESIRFDPHVPIDLGFTSFSAVPEPPAGLLLAGGCLAIGVWCSVRALRMAFPYFGGRQELSVRILNVLPPCLVPLAFLMAMAVSSRADIYRWDNGQLIPGTEGITPGPGVQLDHRELAYAALDGRNLSNSRFDSSNLSRAFLNDANMTNANLASANLTNASLERTTLTNANLSGADLTNAYMFQATLTNADLTGAIVTGADFSGTTSHGFTKAQLYSTASYQQKTLQGIVFAYSDLSGWDFHGQNLANAVFRNYSTLTNASFSGAVITGARFEDTDSFTKEQLYSTASYQAKDLVGIEIGDNDLSGWDFHGQNLTNANLAYANLTNANLSGASIAGARFHGTTGQPGTPGRGFTKEQLYSTVSYQAKNLAGIDLSSNELSGWDFSGQNLTDANLGGSKLTNANLSEAVITGASFQFNFNTSDGLSMEQLYSTASYQAKDLAGIEIGHNDLTGGDFHGQNLTNARLNSSTLTNANLSGANLANADVSESILTNADLTGAVVKGAIFSDTRDFTEEQLYSTASYQQKNLQGIGLGRIDLSGWDFSGQVVTEAAFDYCTGFTKEQLYSTASYQQKNLQGIQLGHNDLSGWDFGGQNLANAQFYQSTLTNADLSGANLSHVFLYLSVLSNANLTGAIARNAILPDGAITGLVLNAGDRLLIRDYHENPNVPDQLPIPVKIHDGLTLANGGVLQLHFDADQWDSTISFQPGIPMSLGGSLELAFADGVLAAEQAGRTFDLFDWTGVSATGAFTIDSDYLWDLSQLYTSGDVTLLSALTGDTDGDGQVGLDDLNNVRNHFGATGAPGLPGDAIPFDGVVDLSDLNAVRNHFGAAATQPVPEPSTIVLTACGLAAVVASRARRRNHR